MLTAHSVDGPIFTMYIFRPFSDPFKYWDNFRPGGSLKGRNSGLTTNGPTDLWVVNRLKETPSRKLAQHLNESLKGRNSGPTTNGPSDLWAINRLKDTPGRKLAQHLNGSLKGRKIYILKIGPSLEWAVNRPKPHRADIVPKYIAGC